MAIEGKKLENLFIGKIGFLYFIFCNFIYTIFNF